MHVRRALPRLTAIAAVALAVTSAVAGCSPAPAPARVSTPTTDPNAGIGTVLARSTSGPGWTLAASRDAQDRLCLSLIERSEGAVMSRTCGLPDSAGSGYTITSAPGFGPRAFYYATVPAGAVKVRLSFAAGGAKTVTTQLSPAQLTKSPRFFVVEVPDAKAGAATVTPLAADGKPLHQS